MPPSGKHFHQLTTICEAAQSDAPGLFHRHRFGEISGLVHVAAAADGDVIREQLQRDDLNKRAEQLDGRRNVDHVLHQAADGRVAFSGYGDDAAGAGGDLLDVGEGLFVAQF